MFRTFFYFALWLFSSSLFAQQNSFSICSWNLKDFGRSKSDAEIEFIALTVNAFDVVLLQEVVAKDPGGAQAVGRLGEALQRLGSQWEYRISDITSGENSYKRERYAFLWKPSKLTLLGKPWLEKKFEAEINREPFVASFLIGSDTVTLLNFHAITKSMQPETEVKYLKFLPAAYPDLHLLFCGDFNLPQVHTVFNPLKKMGYLPALIASKTSLRKDCLGNDCLASEFDNMFYQSERLQLVTARAIPFHLAFSSMREANMISDHLPIVSELMFKPAVK